MNELFFYYKAIEKDEIFKRNHVFHVSLIV